MHSMAKGMVHAMQCFTYMVAFGAQALFLTCLTYTWAFKHSEERPACCTSQRCAFITQGCLT